MYYPYFITYIALGFTVSIVVFLWALKSGQFKDQQRARFLPLVGGHDLPALKVTRLNRYEAYGLLFLAVAGLAASAAVLIYSLMANA